MKQKEKKPAKSTKGKAQKNRVKLGNPVTVLANKLTALFAPLDDVSVAYEYEAKKLRLYVTSPDKSDALNRIVKHHHEIGNLHLDVEVVDAGADDIEVLRPPTWTITNKGVLEAIDKAFKGVVKTTVLNVGGKWYFAEFDPAIVQWQADDLQNPKGFQTATLEQVARDALDLPEGIMLSTVSC